MEEFETFIFSVILGAITGLIILLIVILGFWIFTSISISELWIAFKGSWYYMMIGFALLFGLVLRN
jgi:hypothetical protein